MAHGTSAGILKTVPKYCTVVYVKDKMDEWLPVVNRQCDNELFLARAAIKSSIAGLVGAALTNPFDVLRNEMFKTSLTLRRCTTHLFQTEGWQWVNRGSAKNMLSISVPMSLTIFLTDVFCSFDSHE